MSSWPIIKTKSENREILPRNPKKGVELANLHRLLMVNVNKAGKEGTDDGGLVIQSSLEKSIKMVLGQCE